MDGNPPENKGVGGNVVKCGLLFMFDGVFEGPHRFVCCNLDRKDAIWRVSENPTVQFKDRQCGRHDWGSWMEYRVNAISKAVRPPRKTDPTVMWSLYVVVTSSFMWLGGSLNHYHHQVGLSHGLLRARRVQYWTSNTMTPQSIHTHQITIINTI